eukprot:TRINITY_DN88164_c1_g1_i1.p1 TRINITY_DN88164_c1_g1~~TRINITY_DN88164_c1_g1_i1.p1  ORF type:complete len:762 (-),score=102.71 TRINITY_DN88164_c1_g1_i1:36-2321(-)
MSECGCSPENPKKDTYCYKKNTVIAAASLLGALPLIGLLRKYSMPLFSAFRFSKYFPRTRYTSSNDALAYVPRVEEPEITRAIKQARGNFFVVAGPKKAGKSVMLRHMADTELKRNSLYAQVDQNECNIDVIYSRLAKVVGYHHFHEESSLAAMFCFWRMFQNRPVDRAAFGAYMEKVGKIYQRFSKGKLPVLIIDGSTWATKSDPSILDELGFMAKSLSEYRAMTLVFGLVDSFARDVLKNSGYTSNKNYLKVGYLDEKAIKMYTEMRIAKDHPIRDKVIKAVIEENSKIYGGNLQYLDTFICRLSDAKTEADIESAKAFVEQKVIQDVSDEFKKSKFREQTVLDSTCKVSMLKVFKEIAKAGAISLDRYLSFFSKEDQPKASYFLNNIHVLHEENDVIRYTGKPVQYYVEKELLKKYESDIFKQEEIKREKEMKEYKNILEHSIVEKDLKVKFSDLVGQDEVLDKLMETIVRPVMNPTLFTGIRTPAKGILFYGPPGNGKTMFAKAVASECGKDVTFFNVSSSTFSGKGPGKETDKLIKALFALAIEKQPSVVFIDEMDSILSKRGPNDTEEARKLKNEFLIQFEGVGTGGSDRIVVIGATNRPFDIDDAILRRFTVRIYLDLPGKIARKHAIQRIMKKVNSAVTEAELDDIVNKTNNYSFADLAALCREASYEPLREIPTSDLSKVSQKDLRPVKAEDFYKALERVTRSVADETLNELKHWNNSKRTASIQFPLLTMANVWKQGYRILCKNHSGFIAL